MNKKNFSDAISRLDEKYYDEALNCKKKKSLTPKWIAAVAACLCVAAVGVAFAMNEKKAAVVPSHGNDPEQTATYSSDCNVSKSIAQAVNLDGETYFICGTGEAEILKECNLPESLSEKYAGNRISYLYFDENTGEYVPGEDEKNADGELFEYAPSPGKNVYIVAFGERYYAAIKHDENGYHGIEN